MTVNLVFYDVATLGGDHPVHREPGPARDLATTSSPESSTPSPARRRASGSSASFRPERAFGADGNPDAGIGPDATLLVVFDVVEVAPPLTPSEWTEDVPTVTRDAAGIPTVTIPDAPAPTELQIDGARGGRRRRRRPRRHASRSTTRAPSWETKTVFDQSFGKEPITIAVSGFVPGFSAALVGQKVGSTILVVIPPEYAYGTDPEAHALGGQTLVFLIDILATEGPDPSPVG